MRRRSATIVLGTFVILGVLLRVVTASEPQGHTQAPPPAQPSIRVTMMELHMSPGGVPRGWKFTIPSGDPAAGREAFVKFECFKCHAVQGEHFPAAPKAATDVGPDLTGMGGQHPLEFFAQSVMDPNAVILDEQGYTGPDGKSRMPDYTESMSVRELINLAAYLESLKGGETHGAPARGQQGAMPPGHTMAPDSQGHGAGGAGR